MLLFKLVHGSNSHVQIELFVAVKEENHKLKEKWELKSEAVLKDPHHGELEVKHENAEVGQEQERSREIAELGYVCDWHLSVSLRCEVALAVDSLELVDF